jgi:uncharacterized protein YecT (DUF1311 family)
MNTKSSLVKAGLAIAIALFLILSNAIAPKLSQAQQQQPNCNNPRSTVEYTHCAHLAYQEADRQLNQVYQQLTASLRPNEREKLVDAQITWIKYRDQNCEFEVEHNRIGTGHRAFLGECLEWMTRQRTTEFQNYLSSGRFRSR